ncbi:MAG: L-threonylcarbamoyladenylate synthase [Acidimicrobiia bacterium]
MTPLLDVEAAVGRLAAGELVGFPTETVYGLGADASNSDALRALYAAKGRPAGHPVIVHLGDGAALDAWAAEVPDHAHRLVAQWWPGPLTVVVAASARVSRVATGGLDTVGLRVPDHPVALELIERFGGGVAAPSANRFGRVSSTTAAAVRAEFGPEIAGVVDGGACGVGVESTIVDCTSETVRVLRPGAITAEMIGELLGVEVLLGGTTRAPGTLASHYAPAARVEIVARSSIGVRAAMLLGAGDRVGIIAARDDLPDGLDDAVVTLATADSPAEYARILYSALRSADDHDVDVVLAVPPEPIGIGAAVADRLGRAATGR